MERASEIGAGRDSKVEQVSPGLVSVLLSTDSKPRRGDHVESMHELEPFETKKRKRKKKHIHEPSGVFS